MAEYPITPWLVNHTDPVQAYAHGLQIGSSIGEAQSRQQLAQEQMLREQQKDLVNQEIEKQTFQLKADAAAKRYAAEQKFQQLIQSGVDPLQAILQVPALGNELTPMVQMLRAQQMTPYQKAEIAARTAQQNAPKYFHNNDGTVTQVNADGSVQTLGSPKPTNKRDPLDVIQYRSDLKEYNDILNKLAQTTPTGPTPVLSAIGIGKGNLDTIAKYQKRADELKAKLDAERQGGATDNTTKVGRFTIVSPTASTDTTSKDDSTATEDDTEE